MISSHDNISEGKDEMGFFKKKTKSADKAGSNPDSNFQQVYSDINRRWQEAYRANPRVYEKGGKIVVGLALTETTDSLFPLVPEKQWAISGKTIDLWLISMVSITKDSVLGNIEYHEAIKRLQPYILAQQDGWAFIRGLTLAEMEALFEGLPRDILNRL